MSDTKAPGRFHKALIGPEGTPQTRTFRVIPEEKLPPTWEDEIYGEPEQGTVMVELTAASTSGGHTYCTCNFYYEDGFAKRVVCKEWQLEERFPKSYPTE